MAGAEVDLSKLHSRNTAAQEAIHTNSNREYSMSAPDMETTEEKEKLFTSFSAIFRSQNIPEVKCPLVARILYEHCYAKHWSEQPAPTSSDGVLPIKHPLATKLFAQTGELQRAQGEVQISNQYIEEEEEVDIEGDWNSCAPTIPYDQDRALKLMRECERHVDFACQDSDNKRTGTLSGDEATSAPDDEAQVGLEPKNISKEGWSRHQERVFDRAIHILDGERLARLALASVTHESLKRRAVLDRSAVKFRRLLSILCRWDMDLCRWLHTTLLSSLSRPYLAAYLDILQSLRYLLPTLLEKLWSPPSKPATAKSGAGKATPTAGGTSSSSFFTSSSSTGSCSAGANVSCDGKVGSVAGGGISNAGLNLLLKKPWDPAQSVLHQHKPVKLDPYRSPVVVVVPSGPHSSSTQARRHKVFLSHLQSLTTVAAPHAPPHQLGAPLEQWLEGCVCSVRARLAEYGGRDRPLVLLGWGVAALLACQISSVEPSVAGVVCLSLPFSGHTDGRCVRKSGHSCDEAGETTEDEEENDYVSTTDILHSVPCPVLLVQGDRDPKCSIPRLEAARGSLPHSSQLVVVCGGNGSLRLSSLHRYQAALTTSLVDRCLVDEISTFLSGLIPPRPEDPHPSSDVINTPSSARAEGGAVMELREEGENGSGAVHTYNSKKRKASGEAATTASRGSRPASPKRSRPGTPLFSPAPSEPLIGGPASAASRLQTGTLVMGSSWEEAAHQLPSTLSGNVGGGLVTLGGGGGSAVVLVSSGLPVGSGGPSTMTSVGGVVYSSSPQAVGALSAPASPALILTKEATNWQQHITPSTPTTPCTPTGRGGNKRGRRPGRGRGRGARALPADQLIALGGGVGVAAQAHINSAGRRQSPSMSGRTSRGSRGGGGRGTALPNLQTGNVATSTGYVIAQKNTKTGEVSLMHPPQQQGLLNASRSASPRGMISLTGGSTTKAAGKAPGCRNTATSLKEQIAQASTSQAQLLAAVASITPKSPPRSPQSPANNNNKITTISASTVMAQQLAGQPVTIIQQQTSTNQQQSVQYQIQQQQPFSPSAPGTSFVVSNVGGVSFGRPLVASVLGSADGTSSSGAGRRKGTNTAIMSAVTSSGNIQKNPIMFQTSSGIIGSNRIILPNTMASTLSSSVSLLTTNVASMSTVTTSANGGHRLIRPNIPFTQTRMTTPLILASNQKTVHSLVGAVAGNDRQSNSAVYTSRLDGPIASSVTSSLSLGSVQGLLANAKFVTSSGTARGGATLRGVVGSRGGVIMSRGGILAGGRGSNLINSSRGSAVTGLRNLSPSVKRQLITVGGGGTKIGTTLGMRGTNLVLTTVPITVSGVTSYAVGSSSSPLTVDASTCTSPSLTPVVGSMDGGSIPVTSVRQIQQQQQQQQQLSPTVMQLHQKQEHHSTSTAVQHDQNQFIRSQIQQNTKMHQLSQKQQQHQVFQNRPKTLHGHQILYTTQKASPQTFEVQGSLPSILKVQTATPHHVIKSNTSKNVPNKSVAVKSVKGVPVNTNTVTGSSETVLSTTTASSSCSSAFGLGPTASGDALDGNVQSGHQQETRLTEKKSSIAAFVTGPDASSSSSGCFVVPETALDRQGRRTKQACTSRNESVVPSAAVFVDAAAAAATPITSGQRATTTIPSASGTFIITEEPLASEVSVDAAGHKKISEISPPVLISSDTVDVFLDKPAAESSAAQNPIRSTQDTLSKVSQIASESQKIEILQEVGHSENSANVVAAATQGFSTSSIVSVSCASVHDQNTSKMTVSKPSHSHIKVLTSTPSNLPKLASTPAASNSPTVASSKSGKSSSSVLMSSKLIVASSTQADASMAHSRFVSKVSTLTSNSVNFTTTSKSTGEKSSTPTTTSQYQNVDRRMGGHRTSQTTGDLRPNFSQIVTVSTSGKSVTLSSVAKPQDHDEASEVSRESSSSSGLRNTNFSASSPSIMTVGASEVFASMKTSSSQFTGSGVSKVAGPPVSVVSVSTASASGPMVSTNDENTDDYIQEIKEVDVVQPVEKKNEPTQRSAVHVISTSQAFAYQNNNSSGGRMASPGVTVEEHQAYRQATKSNRILVSKASASTTNTPSTNTLRRASVPDVPPPGDNHQGTVHYVLKQRRPSNASATVENFLKISEDSQSTERSVNTTISCSTPATHESRIVQVTSMSTLTPGNNVFKTITSTSKLSSSKFETISHSHSGVKSSILSKQEPTKISLRDALNMSPDLTVPKKSTAATHIRNPQKLKTQSQSRINSPSTITTTMILSREDGSPSSRDSVNAGTRSSEVIVVSTNLPSSEICSGKSSVATPNSTEHNAGDREQKVLDSSGAGLVMKLLDSASHESDHDSQIKADADLISDTAFRSGSSVSSDSKTRKNFSKETSLIEGEAAVMEQQTASTTKGDTSNRSDAPRRSEVHDTNAKTAVNVLTNVSLDSDKSGSEYPCSKSSAGKSKTPVLKPETSSRFRKTSESDSGVTKRVTRHNSGSDESNQTPSSDPKSSLNPETTSKSRSATQSRPSAVESSKPLRLRSDAPNKEEKKVIDSSASDLDGKSSSASTTDEGKPLRSRPSVSRITEATPPPTMTRRRPADDLKTLVVSLAPTSPPGTPQRASSCSTSSSSDDKTPAKSHVQILKQKTGGGAKLKKRASPRLSLTPYEQAAMLRSGKKRSSL